MLAYAATPDMSFREKLIEDFAAHREATSIPRQRALLDVVIEHTRARVLDKDLERVMATMTPDAVCRFFGTAGIPDYLGEKSLRKLYGKSIDAPPEAEGMQIERMTVGDRGVVIEGYLLLSMELFAAMFPEPAQSLRTGRAALLRKRCCTVYGFDEMKISSVAQYFDGPYTEKDLFFLDEQSFDAGLLARCPFGFLFKGR